MSRVTGPVPVTAAVREIAGNAGGRHEEHPRPVRPGRLGPGTFCSITIKDRGSLLQVGSNDPRAAACDRLEMERAEGPCIQAMDQLYAVMVPRTGDDGRWPAWEAAAAANGFRSMVAMPGYVDDDTTVGRNMYSEWTDTWDVRRLVGMDAYVQEIADTVRAGLSR